VSDRAKVRLFVGIDLPADVRTAIEVATAPLRTTIPGFRWVPVDNLHLTLVFVGWVDPGEVEPIAAAVAASVSRAARFTARLGHAGRFPDRGKARILWVGFDAGADALADLARRAREGVADRVADGRPFRPHVTVARAKQPVRLAASGLEAIAALDRDVAIEGVTVFRSHLGSPHPRYEAVERIGLQGGLAAR
jgi:2'-5' RNA ligase